MSRPIRILQVVGAMNRGGVETWLMHVLRHIDRERFQMDFLVHTTESAAYDDEIRARGSRVIPCLAPNRPWQYGRAFRKIVGDFGPYDVVHSHVHHYSGLVLALARSAGVAGRIAHSHNDTRTVNSAVSPQRKAYLVLMRHLIDRFATAQLAASQEASLALFGQREADDPRTRILYYGIDLTPFEDEIDAESVRTELGIPPNAFVVGHVGSFSTQKNHALLVRIIEALVAIEPRTHALLVGDGELRAAIEDDVRARGLADRVTMTGVRSDVPRLMMGAMDVFVMPSLYEGLPVVGIEAQAAGLPCVISREISPEVIVAKGLVTTHAVDTSPAEWASVILASASETPSRPTRADALVAVRESDLNISNGAQELVELYSNQTKRAAK